MREVRVEIRGARRLIEERMQQASIVEPALLIRIVQLFDERMTPQALYEATRGVWRMGSRREHATMALAVANGVVKEVFPVDGWHPAGSTPYTTRPTLTTSGAALVIPCSAVTRGARAAGR